MPDSAESAVTPRAELQPAIVTEGLYKSFGSVKALDGVALVVQPGTVMALLGPNGAGKTTVIRILATLMRPDSGRAEVLGHDVLREAAVVRSLIGLTGQYAAVDENLTGRENLEMVGRLYHLGGSESRKRAGELLESLDLTEAADRRVKTYSGGMRRRLDLAPVWWHARRCYFWMSRLPASIQGAVLACGISSPVWSKEAQQYC